MTKDIQRILLQACARFIGKKLEPVTKQIEGLTARVGDAFTKAQADELRREWDEKHSKPGAWFDKSLLPAGEPGRDADPVDVDAVADAVVAKLLTSERLETLADLAATKAVAEYFEANPVQDGRDGADGEPGQAGERGEKGADGVGMADALIDRDGALVLTMTDGRAKALGVVVGKDGARGADGNDGTDGLGFDDCDVIYDGERTITVKWQSGDKVKERSFHVPTIIDRGYWREGTEAEAGDAMTHDGTLWIALRATKAKPARESTDWRIGARKGRDGLQGPPGKEYRPPEPVKLGVSHD